MEYILCHKDVEVLSVDYEPKTNKFGEVRDVANEDHIPVGLRSIPGYDLSHALQFWWQSRALPRNRSLYKANNPDLDYLLEGCHGFNLSDHYWIKNASSSMKWKNANFFLNTFNEDVGKYITGETNVSLLKMSSQSPDLFSNGQQDKRWVIRKGKRLLIKYGRPPYCEQPFNEVLACEICRRLEIPFVQYRLLKKGGRKPAVYSVCECFTSPDSEFVPAGFIQYAVPKERHMSNYNHILSCCEKLGIPDPRQALMQMNLLDYVVANVDRHYGNFGFLRNPDTLEWQGAAPNFDTGNAMFYECPTSDLRKSRSLMENVKSRSFLQTQEEQARKFADEFSTMDIDFKRLDGIRDYYENLLSNNPKEDLERIHLLGGMLEKRIENFQGIVLSKNTVVQNMLSLIANNNENVSVTRKLKSAVRIVESEESGNTVIVNAYLKSLKASDPSDFEKKLEKEISMTDKKQKAVKTPQRKIINDDKCVPHGQ